MVFRIIRILYIYCSLEMGSPSDFQLEPKWLSINENPFRITHHDFNEKTKSVVDTNRSI